MLRFERGQDRLLGSVRNRYAFTFGSLFQKPERKDIEAPVDPVTGHCSWLPSLAHVQERPCHAWASTQHTEFVFYSSKRKVLFPLWQQCDQSMQELRQLSLLRLFNCQKRQHDFRHKRDFSLSGFENCDRRHSSQLWDEEVDRSSLWILAWIREWSQDVRWNDGLLRSWIRLDSTSGITRQSSWATQASDYSRRWQLWEFYVVGRA